MKSCYPLELVVERKSGEQHEAEPVIVQECLEALLRRALTNQKLLIEREAGGEERERMARSVAERADLGMRGLLGLVPLAGLEPGLRRIEVVWNAGAADEAAPLDDRYEEAVSSFVIPIAFSPNFEMPLE